NVYAFNREKDLSGSDRPHILAIAMVYDLPFGKGKMLGNNWNSAGNAILGGWKASAFLQYQSGTPVRLSCSQNLFGAGAGSCSSRSGVPLINPSFGRSSGSSSYLNKAAFFQPANGVFGTVGAIIPGIRNPRQENENIALSKVLPLGSEKRTLELRG